MNLCNPLICHGYYDDDDHGYDWFQISCDHSFICDEKEGGLEVWTIGTTEA